MSKKHYRVGIVYGGRLDSPDDHMKAAIEVQHTINTLFDEGGLELHTIFEIRPPLERGGGLGWMVIMKPIS